jgi:hypothetical protein
MGDPETFHIHKIQAFKGKFNPTLMHNSVERDVGSG